LLPGFAAKAGEVIGLDCELCSADGGRRVDRTFVYSSPASVGSPSAFGRVRLVEKVAPGDLQPFGRALFPLSVTQSANCAWTYVGAGVAPALGDVTVRARLLDDTGKVRKTATGPRTVLEGSGIVTWRAGLELFDLSPGTYTLEVTAAAKDGSAVVTRSVKL